MTYSEIIAEEMATSLSVSGVHSDAIEDFVRRIIDDCADLCEDASSIGDVYAARIRAFASKAPP